MSDRSARESRRPADRLLSGACLRKFRVTYAPGRDGRDIRSAPEYQSWGGNVFTMSVSSDMAIVYATPVQQTHASSAMSFAGCWCRPWPRPRKRKVDGRGRYAAGSVSALVVYPLFGHRAGAALSRDADVRPAVPHRHLYLWCVASGGPTHPRAAARNLRVLAST
jgi:hypothetical protein